MMNHGEIIMEANVGKDYRFEETRLNSYETWPVLHLDPAKMAAAGFYYSGIGDGVICFECQLIVEEWDRRGNNPMSEHQREEAECRFIRKIPCGNVPIGVDPETIPNFDCRKPRYGLEIRVNAIATRPEAHEVEIPRASPEGARQKGKVAHPNYVGYESRLKSYKYWPSALKQSKESLASAGFYYSGSGDQNVCHSCGGSLRDWNPTDIPWVMHAMWFPKCNYLNLIKGPEFVKQNTNPPPTFEQRTSHHFNQYIYKKISAIELVGNLRTEVNKYRDSTTQISKEHEEPQPSVSMEEWPLNLSAISKVTNNNLCRSCRSTDISTLFVPCGHAIACEACARTMGKCMICKTSILHANRITFLHQYHREKDQIIIVPSLVSK